MATCEPSDEPSEAEPLTSAEHNDQFCRDNGCKPQCPGFKSKSCGLSLNQLESVPMVTLQTLTSDWSPCTFDSGYGPSPPSSNIRFNFSTELKEKFCTHLKGDGNTTNSAQEQASEESCRHSPRSEYNNDLVSLSPTPPIAIPKGENVTSASGIMRNDNNYFDGTSAERLEKLSVVTWTEQHCRTSSEKSPQIKKSENAFESPIIPITRQRTNSCPESSRSTPSRSAIPLFSPVISPAIAASFHNSVSCRSKTLCLHDDLTENLSSTAFSHQTKEPLPYLHARYNSTPVATYKIGTMPCLLPLSGSITPAGAHDAVIDLSNGNNRRRVLVLALPNVVDTEVWSDGKSGDNENVAEKRIDCRAEGEPTPERHPIQSSLSDCIPPLRSKQAAPCRRRIMRQRALSCDVTLEETAGRALRRIADEFEDGRRRSREESFFIRMRRSLRRSISRLLNSTDDDEFGVASGTCDSYDDDLFIDDLEEIDEDLSNSEMISQETELTCVTSCVSDTDDNQAKKCSGINKEASVQRRGSLVLCTRRNSFSQTSFSSIFSTKDGQAFNQQLSCSHPVNKQDETVFYSLSYEENRDSDHELSFSWSCPGGEDVECFL